MGLLQAGHLSGIRHGLPRFDSGLDDRPHDLGDHLARADDLDPVADPDVLGGDQIFVVQRRPGHGDAGDLHRLQHRVGIERAGAAHVDRDVEQLRLGHLGRELPGDGPARLASADHAQLGVERESIDLHHHAIGLEVEIGNQRLVALDRRLHFIQRVEPLAMGLDLKAPAGEQIEDLGLGAHSRVRPSITSSA